MGLDIKSASLDDDVVQTITQRLSLLPDLRLPHSFNCRGDSVPQSEKKSHLTDLLRRDAALFLERHGAHLSCSELEEFQALKEDYEINWHLSHLKSFMDPTAEERKAHAAVVKNRRLAFMDRLIDDGHFFSEDAMRMRAPLLHHEFLGQFQDPTERAFARPGERWADMVIRQAEEAEYQTRLNTEKEKAASAETEKEEEEEEEEEEDTDEEEEDTDEEDDDSEDDHLELNSTSARPSTFEEKQQLKLDEFTRYMQDKFLKGESSDKSQPSISDEELQSRMEDFTRIMQEKFLNGEDSEHFDYVSIDRDTALDDHWFKELSQDAEDKYFEED